MTLNPYTPHGAIEQILYNNLLNPKLNDQQKAHNLKVLKIAAVLFTLCTLGFGYLLVQKFKTTFTEYQARINTATGNAASSVFGKSAAASRTALIRPSLRVSSVTEKSRSPSEFWKAYIRPLSTRLSAQRYMHPEIGNFDEDFIEQQTENVETLQRYKKEYETFSLGDLKTLQLFDDAIEALQNPAFIRPKVTLNDDDYSYILSLLQELKIEASNSISTVINKIIAYVKAHPPYEELCEEIEWSFRYQMESRVQQTLVQVLTYLDKRMSAK